METNSSEVNQNNKQPIYCVPGDAGPCVDFHGALVATPDASVVEAPPVEPVPVETVDVHPTSSSCGSCSLISLSDNVFFGFALLIPLFIKAFRRF